MPSRSKLLLAATLAAASLMPLMAQAASPQARHFLAKTGEVKSEWVLPQGGSDLSACVQTLEGMLPQILEEMSNANAEGKGLAGQLLMTTGYNRAALIMEGKNPETGQWHRTVMNCAEGGLRRDLSVGSAPSTFMAPLEGMQVQTARTPAPPMPNGATGKVCERGLMMYAGHLLLQTATEAPPANASFPGSQRETYLTLTDKGLQMNTRASVAPQAWLETDTACDGQDLVVTQMLPPGVTLPKP